MGRVILEPDIDHELYEVYKVFDYTEGGINAT